MRISSLVASPVLLLFLALPHHAQDLVGIPLGPNVATPGDPLNEDKAIFTVSTFDDSLGRVFYFSAQNNRILFNRWLGASWEHSTSPIALELSEATPVGDLSVALGVVLKSSSAIFRNPLNGIFYDRIMYFIYQPTPPEKHGGAFGVPCLAFSSQDLGWVQPTVRVRAPGFSAIDCATDDALGLADPPQPPPNHLVPGTIRLEEMAGALTGDESSIIVAGVEGDFEEWIAKAGDEDFSMTFLFEASPSSPHELSLLGQFPTDGTFSPTVMGGISEYTLRNLDFTYDEATDLVLLTRVYAYPYQGHEETLLCTNSCDNGLGTLPMRGQIYSKVLAGDIPGLLVGPWTLEVDVGGPTGWPLGPCPGSTVLANSPEQTDIGLDIDSLNIHKTPIGWVQRDTNGEITTYLGGFEDRFMSCMAATSAASFLDGDLYSLGVEFPLFADGFETGDISRW